MSARKNAPLEKSIQDEIRIELSQMPGVILWRNAVVRADQFQMKAGALHRTAPLAGMGGVGAPDLVGAVTLDPEALFPDVPLVWQAQLATLRSIGRFFALEVKRPGEKARPEQAQWHELARSFGCFVAVVHSVNEAVSAVQRCREGHAQ